MVDISRLKQQILEIVKNEGPVLPVAISRKLGSDTYFAGAVLSELVKSRAVKITNAKIGGSPLYYINGQETKLDKLYGYLPDREKEAYELLRTNQALKDSECTPVERVALRSIKDFSIPFDVNGNLFWRWYLTSEEEARKLIAEIKTENLKQEKKEFQKELEIKLEIKKIVAKEDNFLNLVSDLLRKKNIEIVESNLVRKNREVDGKIKINSDLGILEYYFIAKNKKSLNEADLSLANDSGRKHKLPVLFLSNGKVSKKAEKYLDDNLKGRVVFRKI